MMRIALDLELNIDGVNPTESIIQIGYTAFDTKLGIIETSGDYIIIDKPLYPFIINLTGISQQELNKRGVSLTHAYDNLISFCKKHNVGFWQMVTWGSGDHEELKTQYEQEMQHWMSNEWTPDKPQSWKFGRSECNLKAVYQMIAGANDLGRSGGLKRSMKKMGLDFVPFLDKVGADSVRQRGAHDARCDALNSARFYLHLQEKMK